MRSAWLRRRTITAVDPLCAAQLSRTGAARPTVAAPPVQTLTRILHLQGDGAPPGAVSLAAFLRRAPAEHHKVHLFPDLFIPS